jgi:hypothetical protein
MFNPEDARILPYADAIRFLNALTKDGECPMCKTNLWNIKIYSGDGAYCLLEPVASFSGDAPWYKLNLDCNACGYLRSHKASVVKNWIEHNPETPEASQ